MARTTGRTSYTDLESQQIVDKLTNLLVNDAGIISLLKKEPTKDSRYIESVIMANYIFADKDLTKKIQSVFKEYSIEIEPTQAVTKNEAIIARKAAIKAILKK